MKDGNLTFSVTITRRMILLYVIVSTAATVAGPLLAELVRGRLGLH